MAAKACPLVPQPSTAGQVVVLEVDGSDRIAPTALFGWVLSESTGLAAAKFSVYDGENASGLLLVPSITIAAGLPSIAWFGDQSIQVQSGSVYLDVLAGSIAGVVLLA
jgi:hypothetical protein